MDRCRECGDVKPLDAVGKCRWRAGCEHRQMVHEAEMHRLNDEFAALDRIQAQIGQPSPLLAEMPHWTGLPDVYPDENAPWIGPDYPDDE